MWFPIPFVCVALLCSVIALGLPYWAVYNDIAVGRVNYGIIQTYYSRSNIIYWEYTAQTGSILTVLVLQSLGTLLLAVSLVLAIVKQCFGTDRPTPFRVAAGIDVLAGVVILVGVIIFGIEEKFEDFIYRGIVVTENYRFHAGFYLAIAAGILSFLVAVMLIFEKPISDRRREKVQEQDLSAFHDSSKEKAVGYHGYFATGHRPIADETYEVGYADPRISSTSENRYYTRSSRVKNFAL